MHRTPMFVKFNKHPQPPEAGETFSGTGAFGAEFGISRSLGRIFSRETFTGAHGFSARGAGHANARLPAFSFGGGSLAMPHRPMRVEKVSLCRRRRSVSSPLLAPQAL